MDLYVAGKWADKSVIGEKIKILESNGYKITHNWTTIEEEDKKSIDDLRKFAAFDINGVKEASCLVVIITDKDYPYRGTCTELGAALGLGKEVFVVDPFENSGFSSNIFANHALVSKHKTLDDVLEALKIECNECLDIAGRHEKCSGCECVICSKCLDKEFHPVTEWCDIEWKCKCKKLVCSVCAIFCHDCANEGEEFSVFCTECCPDNMIDNVCKYSHDWSTCGKHEKMKIECGSCRADKNYERYGI